MSTDLTTRDERPIDLDLVKRTVARGATDDELALYLHDCQRRGVHPLDRLLHFSIREDRKTGERRYTPMVSIDFFRSQAADTGEHAGTDDAVYLTEDGTKYPQTASVTVYRLKGGLRCPFTATARWFEYKPQANDFMWVKMPYLMLGKVAEALALRKGFPRELSGLYTHDEMEQAGPPVDPDLSVAANRLSPEEQAAAKAANPQPPPEPHVSQADVDRISTIAAALGLTPAQKTMCMFHIPIKRITNLKLRDLDKFILAMHREAVQKLLNELQLNLDDVRVEDSSVTADVPEELSIDEAQAALAILRACKERGAPV